MLTNPGDAILVDKLSYEHTLTGVRIMHALCIHKNVTLAYNQLYIIMYYNMLLTLCMHLSLRQLVNYL